MGLGGAWQCSYQLSLEGAREARSGLTAPVLTGALAVAAPAAHFICGGLTCPGGSRIPVAHDL